ncbi:MAG: hypothetical protein ABIB93_03440 [Chloroflexota bacterium]
MATGFVSLRSLPCFLLSGSIAGIYASGMHPLTLFLGAAYILSYLMIAIGLYAHGKNDGWGFRMIENSLR